MCLMDMYQDSWCHTTYLMKERCDQCFTVPLTDLTSLWEVRRKMKVCRLYKFISYVFRGLSAKFATSHLFVLNECAAAGSRVQPEGYFQAYIFVHIWKLFSAVCTWVLYRKTKSLKWSEINKWLWMKRKGSCLMTSGQLHGLTCQKLLLNAELNPQLRFIDFFFIHEVMLS